MNAITNSRVFLDIYKSCQVLNSQGPLLQIAAAAPFTNLGQYLGHSLGAPSAKTPTLFCKYQKDPVTGAFDTSCDIKAPISPKGEKKNQAVEYVFDHYLNKKVRCTLVQLQEGILYHAPELASLIDKVIQTEPARKILNQALTDGPIAFFKGDHRNAPGGASWKPKEREIRVRSDETPNRKLGNLLFEIVNALQVKKQLALSKDTDEGIVSK